MQETRSDEGTNAEVQVDLYPSYDLPLLREDGLKPICSREFKTPTQSTPLCQVRVTPRQIRGNRALHHSHTPPCIVGVPLANQRSSPSPQSTLHHVNQVLPSHLINTLSGHLEDVSSSLVLTLAHGISCTTVKSPSSLLLPTDCIFGFICNVPSVSYISQYLVLNVRDLPSMKKSTMRMPCHTIGPQPIGSHYCLNMSMTLIPSTNPMPLINPAPVPWTRTLQTFFPNPDNDPIPPLGDPEHKSFGETTPPLSV